VLNEKGIIERAGLTEVEDILRAEVSSPRRLVAAIRAVLALPTEPA
jgi:hypothetical protein